VAGLVTRFPSPCRGRVITSDLAGVVCQLSRMAITNDLLSVFCWVSQMAISSGLVAVFLRLRPILSSFFSGFIREGATFAPARTIMHMRTGKIEGLPMNQLLIENKHALLLLIVLTGESV